MSGHHFNLNDSHHTTIDINPTHGNDNVICGHGSITTHPFEGPLSGVTTSLNIDGCYSLDSHSLTGPHGHGNPDLSFGIGYNF